MGSQAISQQGGQHALADAAHPQHAHQAATLLEDPPGEFGHFHLAAGEVAHVGGFHQVDTRKRRRLGESRSRERPGPWGKRDRRKRSEQAPQPILIEQHLLVGRLPQRADLLLLAPGSKRLLLHPQGDELFEALGLGVAQAPFPICDGVTGGAQPLGQAHLGQADGGAQRQHQLSEGIVSLPVHMSLHERSPALA
ncbi:MAG TPA: hypothetical protein VF043_19865 [Ktedonobacteraceae bacterium]